MITESGLEESILDYFLKVKNKGESIRRENPSFGPMKTDETRIYPFTYKIKDVLLTLDINYFNELNSTIFVNNSNCHYEIPKLSKTDIPVNETYTASFDLYDYSVVKQKNSAFRQCLRNLCSTWKVMFESGLECERCQDGDPCYQECTPSNLKAGCEYVKGVLDISPESSTVISSERQSEFKDKLNRVKKIDCIHISQTSLHSLADFFPSLQEITGKCGTFERPTNVLKIYKNNNLETLFHDTVKLPENFDTYDDGKVNSQPFDISHNPSLCLETIQNFLSNSVSTASKFAKVFNINQNKNEVHEQDGIACFNATYRRFR